MVNGNTESPEFQMVDGWVAEVEAWGEVEGAELGYEQENSVMLNLTY
jgi:hypothetical protein